MKCPHCAKEFHDEWTRILVVADSEYRHVLDTTACPACRRVLIRDDLQTAQGASVKSVMLWPVGYIRPIPPEVPEPYAGLYREAAATLQASPRGSAALSRRCLQQLLREVAKVPPADLYAEIEWATEHQTLPAYVLGELHDLRTIGNMAAHPIKSRSTGEVVDVEPGEAEWSLDVLDGLFQFLFVQPAQSAARKAALTERLGRSPGDGT